MTTGSVAATPQSASKEMIGTYTLARRLGVGGMGEVWLAKQRGAAGFARDVAIKRLLPQAMEQPDVVQMFIEEAQVTGRLRHPNVVGVIELGAAESGELYLVLEYVDGTGLHKLLRDESTRPTPGAALAIGREMAHALHAAHSLTDDDGVELGLVHRDITPSNIMIDKNGHVKLMDFGIAKVRAKTNQTEAGIIKGKIAYLAPEQLRGAVDPRSDLFTLGLVVWEMLAGKQARSGSSDAVMMAKVALDEIPSLGTVRTDLPAEVVAAVDKACALEPDARYQTGEEMAAAMLAALETLPSRNRMEAAREDLAAAVKAAIKRDGDVATGTTNASRTVDGDKPLALTLHSLVVQQDGVTLSRPLPADLLKAIPPPDARTGSRRTTGMHRKRSNSLFAIVAVGGAVLIVGGALVLRAQERANADAPNSGSTSASAAGASGNANSAASAGGGSGNGAGANTAAAATSADAAVANTAAAAAGDSGANTAAAASDAGAATNVAARTNEPSVARPGTGPRRPATGQTSARVNAASDPNAPDGFIGVVATPWAEVTIDGQRLGITPVGARPFRPGSHTVVLANNERQITRRRTIQLAPGQRLILREDLTRE